MRRYEVVEYTREDLKAAEKDMTIDETIRLLDNLEGGWMPHMPSAYYREDEVCDESDYYLARSLFAVRNAVKLLKQIKKEQTAAGK